MIEHCVTGPGLVRRLRTMSTTKAQVKALSSQVREVRTASKQGVAAQIAADHPDRSGRRKQSQWAVFTST